MVSRTSLHGMWSTRFAFILAVTGSAVGLGNIWKFPYIAGQNGGGAFVLVYLLCVFGIGLPIMMSEILIGRRGRRNPVQTMSLLGEEEGGGRFWFLVGGLGIVSGMLILSFYSVVAGWTLSYIVKSAAGAFGGATADEVGALFDRHQANWASQLVWHGLFMIMTVFVVARGVQRGLEVAVRILMPLLVLLLLVLLLYGLSQGHFAEAMAFMFRPNWKALTIDGVLVALGHAFFTLSVGMGAVMAYGAYLSEDASIASTSIAVVVADTVIAILAGLAIFPLVFANGLDPASGEGLVFRTLPVAFGGMQGGAVVGVLFFIALAFAAWTSSIGLVEPAVAWLSENKNLSRIRASVVVGLIIYAIGVLTVLSFNVLKDVRFARGSLYQNIDFFTSNILLPLCGFFIVVFAGWVMCRNSSSDELRIGTGTRYAAWRFLSRYVAPLAIVAIFVQEMKQALT